MNPWIQPYLKLPPLWFLSVYESVNYYRGLSHCGLSVYLLQLKLLAFIQINQSQQNSLSSPRGTFLLLCIAGQVSQEVDSEIDSHAEIVLRSVTGVNISRGGKEAEWDRGKKSNCDAVTGSLSPGTYGAGTVLKALLQIETRAWTFIQLCPPVSGHMLFQ